MCGRNSPRFGRLSAVRSIPPELGGVAHRFRNRNQRNFGLSLDPTFLGQAGCISIADTRLMYGVEVGPVDAVVVYAGLPVAMLPDSRSHQLRATLGEMLPWFLDARASPPTLEVYLQGRLRESEAEVADLRLRLQASNEALAGMRPESGEPSRKRARGEGV